MLFLEPCKIAKFVESLKFKLFFFLVSCRFFDPAVTENFVLQLETDIERGKTKWKQYHYVNGVVKFNGDVRINQKKTENVEKIRVTV